MKIKKRWKQMGLNEEGARRADKAMPLLLSAIEILGNVELITMVLREAMFVVHELPARTKEFRQRYQKENE